MGCPICQERSPINRLFHVEMLRIPRTMDGLLARCDAPVRRVVPAGTTAPSLDSRGVAWFRWIVGHQVLFMQWRLLAESLNRAVGRGVPGPVGGCSADALIDLCSVLFLYCGSCTPATYLDHLRPAMARQHPAFSGEWAADYRAIPVLVREVVRSEEHTSELQSRRDLVC